MKKFAVFGNPISHSKSPRIHQLFSEQTAQPLDYVALSSPQSDFAQVIIKFFADGAVGANITTPFKEQAYTLSHELTERAKLAGAVNTLKRQTDGSLLGDNTDGIGLVSDLERLMMLKPGQHVLLIGAGGAARGVILPLLDAGVKLVITNRTYSKAANLAEIFSQYGDIVACDINQLKDMSFDLIVNATASGIQGDVPAIPASLITANTACYDMFYGQQLTPFLQWVKQQGAVNIADGLGMLVGQAAHSFYLWHGVMPDIEQAILLLRQELAQ